MNLLFENPYKPSKMAFVITPFIKEGYAGDPTADYIAFPIENPTVGLQANAYYFNHPEWVTEYLTCYHRSSTFISRWRAALESWDNKIVVDIGCGPGNFLPAYKENPNYLLV